MTEEFVVLVEEILFSEDIISKLTSKIGFSNIVIVTTDNPSWDTLYSMARITDFHGIPTPLDNRFALILSKENSNGLEYEGMSYGKRRGFTIVVRDTDSVENISLKFKYEFLRRLGMPADAITYYYTVKTYNKFEMLKYIIFCLNLHMFKYKYGNKYYDMLFNMYKSEEKPSWRNSSKTNWE